MSTRSRCWLVAGLTLAAAAALGVVALLGFGADELEAARRRVPLGADEEAVAQAVGRPADGRVGLAGAGVSTRLDHPGECGVTMFCTLTERTHCSAPER